MNKIFFWFSLIFVFLFTACDSMLTEVDVDPPKAKLVFFCVINPDDTDTLLYASLSHSYPLYVEYNQDSPAEDYVPGATIRIGDGLNTVVMEWDPLSKKYFVRKSLLIIEPDRKYTIEAEATGYETIYAETVIPAKLNTSCELVSFDSVYNDECGSYDRVMKLKYTDMQGLGDYYQCTLISEIPDQSQSSRYKMVYNDDEDGDGSVFYYDEKFGCSSNYIPPGSNMVFYSELRVCDRNYYLFHKSIQNPNSDGPFSEPSLVFSNVKNGLGYFGSYRVFVKKIDW